MITDKIGVMFSCVQASSCDPEEFVAQYPEKKILSSQAALKMRPRVLYIDYKNKDWIGEFTI